jgi:hypothetical protein
MGSIFGQVRVLLTLPETPDNYRYPRFPERSLKERVKKSPSAATNKGEPVS